MDELWAAVIGAAVGALLAVAGGYLQHRASRAQDREERSHDERVKLVREIMRYRRDQQALVYPLNELPLVFGDDPEVMRLYRGMLRAPTSELMAQDLADLINHLAKSVGLPREVQASDIHTGFSYSG